MRKTKIVVTIGPATDSKSMIKKLITNGVNVFRLNFSHATHEYHQKTIEKIRAVSKEIKKEVAILQDISGPKIRVCELENPMELKVGEIITLSKDTIDEKNKVITLSYPQIIDSLQIDEQVYFSDGTIRSKVIEKTDNYVKCEIMVAQILQSKKGINFPNTKLKIDTITKKDKKDLIFGATQGVDIVALSFVSSKDDVNTARAILNKEGSYPFIFSKIEKPEAMENLDSILKASDGVMVARGDLGVELGLHNVPAAQKLILKRANELSKPSITATQMLTSMIESPYPTRAEISDIANAVLDGSDAVMLSDETTIGKYPLETIDVLNDTLREAEKIYPYYKDVKNVSKKETIASAATIIGKNLESDALITLTRTGRSVIQLSKFRPKAKIIAGCYDLETKRKLQVVWGAVDFYLLDKKADKKSLLKGFLKSALENNSISLDKNYVLTMGYPLDIKYPTNQIKLLDKSTINYYIK